MFINSIEGVHEVCSVVFLGAGRYNGVFRGRPLVETLTVSLPIDRSRCYHNFDHLENRRYLRRPEQLINPEDTCKMPSSSDKNPSSQAKTARVTLYTQPLSTISTKSSTSFNSRRTYARYPFMHILTLRDQMESNTTLRSHRTSCGVPDRRYLSKIPEQQQART